MGREERPGVDGPGALLRQVGEAGDEVGAIRVVPEEDGPFNAPHHDMVDGVEGIETQVAGHGESRIAKRALRGKVPLYHNQRLHWLSRNSRPFQKESMLRRMRAGTPIT